MAAATLCQQQQQRGLGFPHPGVACLLVLGRVAAASVWNMLANFVGLCVTPVTWLAEVHLQHPFLGVQTGPTGHGSPSLLLTLKGSLCYVLRRVCSEASLACSVMQLW